ncbi:sulfur carrier protein ThiS [Tepidimonas charontis]|uniref:Mut7-C ubiquitin n=1 Tax=Tepidimonas charontis TaxID=2267262 RepID=A0A554XGP9_9BURK|nr:MoaD/ThiS family protein [Tepidimonas charontis]TSE34998.1 Mut7-C ubiquitin [Tepidimonas charontis]
MPVTLKLFATLSDHLPPQARQNQVELDWAVGQSVQAVIDHLGLPPKLVHLVLVDGVFIPPPQRATRLLKDGEALAIWPPIAGG